MLDNYDTNLHLKHTEHLAGWCTVAMITGEERIQAQTSRDFRGQVHGHVKLLASGPKQMWEKIYFNTLKFDLNL